MAQSLQESSTDKQRWWKEAVVYQVSLIYPSKNVGHSWG